MKNNPIVYVTARLCIMVLFACISFHTFSQSYLPLTGGTLTGNLNLSSATQIQAPYYGLNSAYSPPATSGNVALFANSSSSTLDIVGFSNGWRFIPINGSTYPAPVATIDNSGNATLTGGLTTAGLSAKGAAIDNTGAATLVIIGAQNTGRTMLQLGTSSDAGGYGYIQSISAQGVAWGNTVINPSAGNVLIGRTTQNNTSYILDVNGPAHATSVVVNTLGADFVFAPKYKLAPLSFVEKYIDKNHHLPEIPSAKQMQANGLDVGKNETKLLQKVEELTLYLIEKDKEIKKQQEELDLIKKQLQALTVNKSKKVKHL